MSIFHVKYPRMKHEENSVQGIREADRRNFDKIDLDLQITKDGVIVVTHWAKPMRRDRFYDPLGRISPDTPIHKLTWRQVKRLRTKDGYRICRIERILRVCARHGIVAVLEPKGDPRFGAQAIWDYIAAVAARRRCRIQVYTLRANRAALAPARLAGIKAWALSH